MNNSAGMANSVEITSMAPMVLWKKIIAMLKIILARDKNFIARYKKIIAKMKIIVATDKNTAAMLKVIIAML